jgi:hypothetical protein
VQRAMTAADSVKRWLRNPQLKAADILVSCSDCSNWLLLLPLCGLESCCRAPLTLLTNQSYVQLEVDVRQ